MTHATWGVSAKRLLELCKLYNWPCNVQSKNKSTVLTFAQSTSVKVPWRKDMISARSPQIIIPACSQNDDTLVIRYLHEVITPLLAWDASCDQELDVLWHTATFIDENHRRQCVNGWEERLRLGYKKNILIDWYNKTLESRQEEQLLSTMYKRFSLDDYPNMYAIASNMKRHAIVMLGPTNSGKTYQALQLLKKAKNGAYLGPLRLLALEVYEELNEDGVKCSLLTGEEQILEHGAAHTASTVEMMQSNIELDTVVIDEVQMLADEERGWAWTQAIVGCPAETMILVGAPEIWPLLKSLLQRLNVTYTVERKQRLQPLHIDNRAITIDDAKDGDAFVVFSRKDVFLYQELLAKKGLSTAVIYGALGPEVRRSEAERFRSGQAKVLIATDAIGMGLNLPISRIVLTTAEKFNGVAVNFISPALVRQIAGRAGRYGKFDDGIVTALDQDTLNYVSQCMAHVTKVQHLKVAVAPTVQQLRFLANEMKISSTSKALRTWRNKLLLNDSNFFAAPLYERLLLAEELENHGPSLTFEDVTKLSMAPLPRNQDVRLAFMLWIKSLNTARKLEHPAVLRWTQFHNEQDYLGIEEAERFYHTATLYCWLNTACPNDFPDGDAAQEARTKASKILIKLLKIRASMLVESGRIKNKLKRKV